jgi:hypothetical protein
LALARVDSSVLVVTNTLQDTMPQLYYRGDANQRLQHGTANNIIDVDWKNRLGQDQNHLWRRFHQLSAVDRQHIVDNGLDFQLIPELEEQIHRLALRASLLDLLQTTRVAGEHLNFQEGREWCLHLGDEAVGHDFLVSNAENPQFADWLKPQLGLKQ